MPERTKTLICVGLLFLMTVLFFAPVVFSDKTLIARDNYIFYNPRQFYAADTMKQGEIPYWNPYNACGVPFQANLQNSLFYPVTLIYYVLPFQTGFKYYIILHYFLASLFMFILMRGWGKTRGAGLVAGMVFAFGGYMFSLNEYVAFLTAGSWLPLILLFHHYALKTCKLFYALLCGITIAMQVFAGDISFYFGASILCTFVYTIYYLIYRRDKSLILKYSCFLLLSWLAGIMIASVQIVPFAEYIYHSCRFGGLAYEQATKWSFSFIEIFQLFIPHVLGNLAPQTKWAGQVWLDTIYSGIFTIILAYICVFFSKDALKSFLLSLILLSIFFASGEYNPLYKYFFDYIPLVRMVQYPVKVLFVAVFALSVLAGIGAQEFLKSLNGKAEQKVFFLSLIISCLLIGFFLVFVTLKDDDMLGLFSLIYLETDYHQPFMKAQFYKIIEGISVLLGFLALFSILAYIVIIKRKFRQYFVPIVVFTVFLDLLFIGKPERPLVEESLIMEKPETVKFLEEDESLFRIYSLSQYASRRSFLHLYYMHFEKVYRMLKEAQQANLNIYHKIQSAEEYADARNENFSDVFRNVIHYFRTNYPDSSDPNSWQYTKKTFDLLNIKYIISPYNLTEDGLELVQTGKVNIYKNPDSLSRVFFYDNIFILNSDTEVVDLLTTEFFDPQKRLFTTHNEINKAAHLLEESSASGNKPFIWNAELTEHAQGEEKLTVHLQNADSADRKTLEWSADFKLYSANRIKLDVDVNKFAFLFISDTYYPGWKAYINGRETPVMRVNHAFRGVAVEEGSHTVEFVFKPLTFKIGASVSIVSLLIVMVCMIGLRRREKHRLERG